MATSLRFACGLRGEAVEQVDLLEQVQAVLGDPPTRRLLHRRQDPRRVLSLSQSFATRDDRRLASAYVKPFEIVTDWGRTGIQVDALD